MLDESRFRPVSGEIMAVSGPCREAKPDAAPEPDIVDAEFETVRATPGRMSMLPRDAAARSISSRRAPALAGMDLLRPDREACAPAPERRGGAAFRTGGAVLVLAAFWLSGGHSLLDGGSVGAIGSQPLRLADVRSRLVAVEGRRSLMIDGDVVNESTTVRPAPMLTITIDDDAGKTTRYLLDTGGVEIAPGGRFAFSSRLAAPAEGIAALRVSMK